MFDAQLSAFYRRVLASVRSADRSHLVFYEPILWGIDRGITRYRLGTESYGAKRARGCRFSPLFGVVRWPDEVAAGAAAAAARWGDRVVAEAAMNPAALRGDG